jgi:septal ring factor EnvC (AmiA/AmiB activator)
MDRGQGLTFVFFLGVTGGLLLHPLSAHATYAEKASTLHEELLAKKAAHDALLKKSTVLNSQVSTLKASLVSVSKDLQTSEENLSATDQNLKDLRQKKEQCVQSLYKDQRAMGGLVSAVSKYSRTSTPDMLLQAKPIDAARASLVMKLLLPQLQEQSDYLKAQIAEIKKVEGEITSQLEVQMEQSKKLTRQQENLTALLQERRKVYKSTENERQSEEKEVVRLTKESNDIEELMEKLKSKSKNSEQISNLLPSNMIRPVNGKVVIGFGNKDPMGAPSKGITFITRSAANVIVPLAGVVKFAGPFQKYKQILIVEHEGGYHSLIAGLGRIDTVVGASLAAGEPVGIAETGSSPQIYYELRQNGKPINPQKSLLAQRKQEKS